MEVARFWVVRILLPRLAPQPANLYYLTEDGLLTDQEENVGRWPSWQEAKAAARTWDADFRQMHQAWMPYEFKVVQLGLPAIA